METKTCTLTSNVYETIEIASDNVTLDGNGARLTGYSIGGLSIGVFISNHRNVEVKNLEVEGFSTGILMRSSQFITLRNNHVFNNSLGFRIESSADSLLENNHVTDNRGIGIYFIFASSHMTMRGNEMDGSQNDIYLRGTLDFGGIGHDIDTTNTVGGKSIYYFENHEDVLIENIPDMGAFYCISCRRVTVRNVIVDHPDETLFFIMNTDDSLFENITISSGNTGVRVRNSHNNTFTGNNIGNNLAGVLLQAGSSGNVFYRNNFYGNFFDDVHQNVAENILSLDPPLGGNYWDRFDEPEEGCEDDNADSFCDSPYSIPFWTGTDYYPWIRKDAWDTEPEPEIDPLLLQYEPILLLHPDENYKPMNVEAFVNASSLWDDEGLFPDMLIKAESESDPVTLDDISVPSESEDWYLQFSGGSEAEKTFSTTTALQKYQNLTADGDAVPTYYGYKMEDSFIDDEGVVHEFIVLQYWYFYAFNDWQEHGGFNNHEGDWETVMVFLDKATEEPRFIAYSAHLNDGDPSLSVTQFDSVRRVWDSNEIEKDGERVMSYVALGSHANYPSNGVNGEHIVPVIQLNYLDLTSFNGEIIHSNSWNGKNPIALDFPNWILGYEGKWGADTTAIGSDAPQGPNFISPLGGGGVSRFNEPIKWAGIDKDAEKEITADTDTLTFTNQSTAMYFEESVGQGTIISVSQHDEFIGYGTNVGTVDFLPHFWDLESNLGGGMPTTTVSFTYDAEEVDNFGIIEQDLEVFFYNEETNSWDAVVSLLDVQTSTVSFTTNHFSRYAIGAKKWEYITDDVLIKQHWGKYDPKAGTREAYIDISGEDLPEILRLLVPSVSNTGIYLLNNTGTTTEGVPFIDFSVSDSQFEIPLVFSVPYKEIRSGDNVTYVPDPLKFDFEVEVQSQL
ncbi:right-handed parallel beta-helix repeat-containing protein [Candidatus Roizmanbacteria bacterium]|nr:right-handed parallel beta-helix repeat-containing protein [Candidatus Roizmanbacteria bacterium]